MANFYILLFLILQIFIILLLFEKRKRHEVKLINLYSFWPLIVISCLVLVFGISFTINNIEKNEDDSYLYDGPTKIDEFTISNIFIPLKDKVDFEKDIYISSYNIYGNVDKDGNICRLLLNFYASVNDEYYQCSISFVDGRYEFNTLSKVDDGVYKKVDYLLLSEVLLLEKTIDYSKLIDAYNMVEEKDIENEEDISDCSFSFIFYPERLDFEFKWKDVYYVNKAGEVIYLKENTPMIGSCVVISISEYSNPNNVVYYLFSA